MKIKEESELDPVYSIDDGTLNGKLLFMLHVSDIKKITQLRCYNGCYFTEGT